MGTIVSPGYPNFYTSFLDCTYQLQAERGRKIEIEIDADTEKDFDFVIVRTAIKDFKIKEAQSLVLSLYQKSHI